MLQSYEEFLEERLEEIQFEDVFVLSELQELQDMFAESLQIASVITSVEGEPLTRPSNFCRLCKDLVRKTEKGYQQCVYSDSVIGGNSMKKYTVSRCLSVGLLDAGVSIVVGKKHIANWMFGQVNDGVKILDETSLREKALEFGIDEEEFIEAYREVPIISKNRFDTIAGLVHVISKQLSELAYQTAQRKIDEQYRKILSDLMERQKREVEYASTIDELTKLNNRNYFEHQTEQLDYLEITPVAVVVADVNNLKVTNDIFGHRHGDYLLSQVAEIMKDEAFDGYIVCRCGGDEFYVLMPNANRQEAEWYCKRVRLELAKRFDCCFKISVAFGVGKKSYKYERLKDVLEMADYKMYRDKVSVKEKEDLIASIQAVLLGRGSITPGYQETSISMARRFGEYLQLDERLVKSLTRAVRVQDYGQVIIPERLFANRFNEDITDEFKREYRKHPTLGSKIAQLKGNYAEVSEVVQCHEENWDGSGFPNRIKGDAIPFLSRLSKLVGDYNTYIAEAPVGMGKSKEEACCMIEENLGTLYDPEYGQKFLSFLEQDKEPERVI